MQAMKDETFLDKYDYLEELLKISNINYKKTDVTLENFTVILNKYILGISQTTNDETVQTLKNMFFFLIENSIKMDKNTIAFKTLIYFLVNGFRLFVSSLKEEKNKDKNVFLKELYKIISIKNISESLKLEKKNVKKELNINVFIKIINKKKLGFKNKIYYIFLLFFKNYQNDKNIKEQLNKYISENNIKEYYDDYNKMILQEKYNVLKNALEKAESNLKKDKNEIKITNEIKEIEEKDNFEIDDTKQTSNNSSNPENNQNEKSETDDYVKNCDVTCELNKNDKKSIDIVPIESTKIDAIQKGISQQQKEFLENKDEITKPNENNKKLEVVPLENSQTEIEKNENNNKDAFVEKKEKDDIPHAIFLENSQNSDNQKEKNGKEKNCKESNDILKNKNENINKPDNIHLKNSQVINDEKENNEKFHKCNGKYNLPNIAPLGNNQISADYKENNKILDNYLKIKDGPKEKEESNEQIIN